MITGKDEIDLTSVPVKQVAKLLVLKSMVDHLRRLIEQYPDVMKLIEFHATMVPVVGHRRLGRIYSNIQKGKDPLTNLEEMIDDRTGTGGPSSSAEGENPKRRKSQRRRKGQAAPEGSTRPAEDPGVLKNSDV